MTRDHKQRSGRLRKRTLEQIYHSKKKQSQYPSNKSHDHTSNLRGSAKMPMSTGRGKIHYESKDYYRLLQRVTSLWWWQVEPFKSRTLDLVAVASDIDRLLRLPLAATNTV